MEHKVTRQHAATQDGVMWTADNLPLFDNAQAWTGPAMAERDDWIYTMSADEIAEVDAAVAQIINEGCFKRAQQ